VLRKKIVMSSVLEELARTTDNVTPLRSWPLRAPLFYYIRV